MLRQGLANLFSKTSQYFKLCGPYSLYCDDSVLMQKDEEEYYFQRFGEQITQPRKLKLHQLFCSMYEKKGAKKTEVGLHAV